MYNVHAHCKFVFIIVKQKKQKIFFLNSAGILFVKIKINLSQNWYLNAKQYTLINAYVYFDDIF